MTASVRRFGAIGHCLGIDGVTYRGWGARIPAAGVGGASQSLEAVVKVQASVKRICNQCQIVRRKGKVRVICKADPKHKQVQG